MCTIKPYVSCVLEWRARCHSGPAGIRRCSLTIYDKSVRKCGRGARGEGREFSVFGGSVFGSEMLKTVSHSRDEVSASIRWSLAEVPSLALRVSGMDTGVKSLLDKDL